MAKAADPRDELVRRNMVRFREEADLSQAELGDLSGVPVDAIRRYETGVTQTVPGTVLSELARVYGRSMDDFFATNPPKVKIEEAPALFLRTRPGAKIDLDVYKKVQAMIDDAPVKARLASALGFAETAFAGEGMAVCEVASLALLTAVEEVSCGLWDGAQDWAIVTNRASTAQMLADLDCPVRLVSAGPAFLPTFADETGSG